jgi:mono/diheme cytochrome c family protein
MVSDLAQGAIGYITYSDLRTLRQVTVTVRDDLNFPGQTITVTGIYLDVLAHAIGALPSSDLIDTLCTDHYRGHYPATYIAAHKPIFALRINGLPTRKWAAQTHLEDPGPYFITYAHFVPTFQILSHEDKPQTPINITRLNFTTTALTFAAIQPRGSFPADSPVQQGFAIAKQNCLRCHNQGPYGGTKAGRDWFALSTWAREQPAFFAAYIHNPQSIEPHTHMPANPAYDAATLAALTAYFQTFTADVSAKNKVRGP